MAFHSHDSGSLAYWKAIAALAVGFWLTVPAVVQLLVVLCLFDLLSTLMTHRSSFGQTARRVSVTLFLCGCVHLVYAMGMLVSGLNIGWDVGTAVSGFYVFGEILEIVLNCATVINVPPWLLEWCQRAQQGMGGRAKRD